ncbi:MAG: hypothetical protein IJA80_02495 [Clostridia bacterium]|nr:hypothetical protein [Clostridia bacterium]
MDINLKETLDKIVEEKMRPTEKDRIVALENALTDIAMMVAGVENND